MAREQGLLSVLSGFHCHNVPSGSLFWDWPMYQSDGHKEDQKQWQRFKGKEGKCMPDVLSTLVLTRQLLLILLFGTS